MRFGWLGALGLTGISSLLAGIAMVLLAVLLPLAGVQAELVKNAFPIAAFALILAAALIMALYSLLTMAEIVTSQNDIGWRVMWIALILVFGIVTLAVYELIAKKDLK